MTQIVVQQTVVTVTAVDDQAVEVTLVPTVIVEEARIGSPGAPGDPGAPGPPGASIRIAQESPPDVNNPAYSVGDWALDSAAAILYGPKRFHLLVGEYWETFVPLGGPGGSSYTHTQSTPSDVWTINHNLGFAPIVELFSVGGVEFDAEVVHVNPNQTVVYLNDPIAGSARLV